MWVKVLINDSTLKESPRDLALKFESKIHAGQLLFIALEKNKNGIYILLYKKRIHEEASTIVDYLPIYFYILYGDKILHIFEPYYQDLAKDATWIDKQPYYEDNLELHKVINNKVDLE